MKAKDSLDHLRIASPCPTSWEQMAGDDRVRHCDLCNLHVYNIAELTRKEAKTLIANSEGRVCAQLYRRSDGTVITKDCPVGLRAIRRHVAKVAGAVFATIMSLFGSIVGQKQSPKDKSSCTPQVTVTRSTPQTESDAASITGTVCDSNGAALSGVKIQLTRKNELVTASESDEKGAFRIQDLKADTYELTFEFKGFTRLKIVEIKVADQESVTVSAMLMPKGVEVVVGIVGGYESLLDTPLGTTIFSGDLIRRLPMLH